MPIDKIGNDSEEEEFLDAVSSPEEKIIDVNEDETEIKRKEEEEKLSEPVLKERCDLSITIKNEGNKHFQNQEFDEAISKYSEALALCPLIFTSERSIMLSNRAACYVHLDKKEEALKDSNESLKLNPNYVKCLIRRGELLFDSEDYEDSFTDFKKVIELDPSNKSALQKCQILPGLIDEKREKMKEEMMTQLKSLGNMVLKPFGLSTDNFKVQKDENTGSYSINFAK